MEELLQFLREFNIQTILSMLFIVWYFTSDLKKSVEAKIDNLDREIHQMNTRVGRLEGTVYGKDIYKHVDEPKN